MPRFSALPVGMPFAIPFAAHVRDVFPHRARVASLLLAFVVAVAGSLAPQTAWADSVIVKAAELRAGEDSWDLSAEFEFAINPTLDEALQKGIPLYFVLEFEVVRPRWYWLDEKVLSHTTQYRVSYNALTRQYRVASGLLTQTLNSLAEVERLLSRVTSRPVAGQEVFVKGVRYEAAVRLRLDVNQLPKPFQVNALAAREWTLASDWYRWSFTP